MYTQYSIFFVNKNITELNLVLLQGGVPGQAAILADGPVPGGQVPLHS